MEKTYNPPIAHDTLHNKIYIAYGICIHIIHMHTYGMIFSALRRIALHCAAFYAYVSLAPSKVIRIIIRTVALKTVMGLNPDNQ